MSGAAHTESVQWFVCPECKGPVSEVIHGRELQVVALEILRMSPQPRLVEVRQNVLRQNDIVARELRSVSMTPEYMS